MILLSLSAHAEPTNVSTQEGLTTLAQRADKANIIFIGEAPHWGSDAFKFLAKFVIALSEREPVGLLALELPYSMSPWLDRYVTTANDDVAANILSELRYCSLFIENSAYEELLESIRAYNKIHSSSIIHVGGWDVDMYADWLSLIYSNSSPNTLAHLSDNIRAGAAISTASYRGGWDWRREEVALTNLFNPDYLPKYREAGRMIIFGGSAHTETKRGCDPRMEGCASARQQSDTDDIFSLEFRMLSADLSGWDSAAIACGQKRNDWRLTTPADTALARSEARVLFENPPDRLSRLLSPLEPDSWWWVPQSNRFHNHDELVVIKKGSFASPRCLALPPERYLPSNTSDLEVNIFLWSDGRLSEATVLLSGDESRGEAQINNSNYEWVVQRWFEGIEPHVNVEVRERKSGQILIEPTFNIHLRPYISFFSGSTLAHQTITIRVLQLPDPKDPETPELTPSP